MNVFEDNRPDPSPPAGAPPVGLTGESLVFTGRGEEYFKIWAVNLGLTILTLGIYSAWAKVRRLRYFYGNTLYADSSFDFHGSPMAILRGRIVAVVLLIAYSRSPSISPILYAVILLFLLLAFPWLYWRSLRFRLGNTSWRGVRFHFTGSLAGAYRCVFPPLLIFAAINSLAVMARLNGKLFPLQGLGAAFGYLYLLLLAISPYFYHRIRAYQHANSRFGQAAFGYHGTPGMIYGIAFRVAAALIPVIAVALGLALSVAAKAPLSRGVALGSLAVALFISYVLFLLAMPMASARAQNLVWGSTELQGVPIRSALSAWEFLGVSVINVIATALTLGLFRPFAVIRTLRVRVPAISYAGDPEVFVATAGASSGAVGEAVTDLFGFDIAL